VGRASAVRARKLARLSVTAAARRDGMPSGGQVEAIAANLDANTVDYLRRVRTRVVRPGLPVTDDRRDDVGLARLCPR
jgi:hypothetical protein